MLSATVLSLTVATLIKCVVSDIPLVDKHFEWDHLPYKADLETGGRGPQFGYNLCNSTTEGPNSLCQTMVFNSLDDFCIWIPPEPNSIIGNVEGEAIAACTKKGYGTRLIPEGVFKGIQFTTTPDYIQIVAHIDQVKLNIQASDGGGELDSAGADKRGNPIGGLVYTTAFSADKKTFEQANYWTEFIGDNTVCIKVCDNKKPNPARYCQHIYDRMGCGFNVPSNVTKGVFESCDGDNQRFVGEYTLPDGTTTTWYQPGEGTVPVAPYTPVVPASSNCKPTPSNQIWTDAAAPTTTTTAGSPAVTNPSGTSSRPTGTNAPASKAPTQTPGSSTSTTANGFTLIGSFLAIIFFI